MNISKTSLALLLLAFTALAGQASGAALSVNGTEIARSKVQAQVDRVINQRGLNSGGITQPAVYQQLQREVVEQLIVQKLLWQEAQKRQFNSSDDAVDRQLEVAKNGFDTPQAFLFQIKAGGFSERSYREDIRQRQSVQQMISTDLAPQVAVGKKDIEAFYTDNLDQMTLPEQRRAKHILVKLAGDDEAARKLAVEKIHLIQEQLRGDADFDTLAREYSEAPSAPQGGDLGFFGRGQMVPAFENSAFALQPGETSDIVETRFGFHVIRLEEIRETQTVSVTLASERISAYLKQAKLQEAVEELVQDLRASAQIVNTLAP
jgi:peptidyl-prolyl cis-trans isomerase C